MTPRVLLAAVLLAGCGPTTQAPAATPSPRPVVAPAETPAAYPTSVRGGAYCKPEGATAITQSGRTVRCVAKPGEKTPRWRTR